MKKITAHFTGHILACIKYPLVSSFKLKDGKLWFSTKKLQWMELPGWHCALLSSVYGVSRMLCIGRLPELVINYSISDRNLLLTLRIPLKWEVCWRFSPGEWRSLSFSTSSQTMLHPGHGNAWELATCAYTVQCKSLQQFMLGLIKLVCLCSKENSWDPRNNQSH